MVWCIGLKIVNGHYLENEGELITESLFLSCKIWPELTSYDLIWHFRYILLGTALLSLIPAYLFSIIEGWSYLDSWYFTVVSLTTIGFGDYAPSFITDSGFLSVYRMMALCWLLIGLAWLGGLLSLMTTLFGEIQNSIFIGPIKLKSDYEAKNLHSNEQMKSIKRVRRNQNRQTSLEQKRRDREEAIMRRNGNRRVKYMHNIEL